MKEFQKKTFYTSFSKYNLMIKKLLKNKMAVTGGIMIICILLIILLSPLIMTHSPTEINVMERLEPPSIEHWFGTDANGRDIYSRIIKGTQLTLLLGIAPVGIGGTIGAFLGLLAGFYGRWVDTIIMRIADVFLAFPGILLALGIVSALGPSMVNVIIALSIYNIPIFARIVRGSTLETVNLEYVDAVYTLGAKDSKILFQHILPNITSPVIVQSTIQVATTILSAASLSFLGLGAQPPTPEWGTMLSEGRDYMWEAAYITTIPGIAIAFVVTAFNLLGDGLRDVLDPRM